MAGEFTKTGEGNMETLMTDEGEETSRLGNGKGKRPSQSGAGRRLAAVEAGGRGGDGCWRQPDAPGVRGFDVLVPQLIPLLLPVAKAFVEKALGAGSQLVGGQNPATGGGHILLCKKLAVGPGLGHGFVVHPPHQGDLLIGRDALGRPQGGGELGGDGVLAGSLRHRRQVQPLDYGGLLRGGEGPPLRERRQRGALMGARKSVQGTRDVGRIFGPRALVGRAGNNANICRW